MSIVTDYVKLLGESTKRRTQQRRRYYKRRNEKACPSLDPDTKLVQEPEVVTNPSECDTVPKK